MTDDEKTPVLAHEPDFSLGFLRVSPSAGRVYCGKQEQRVEALTMSVLIVLARAQGGTVSRDELIQACWQGRIVSDDAITRAIAKVRVLSRVATPEAFSLETVPKVGYRLKAAEPAVAGAPSADGQKAVESPVSASATPPPGKPSRPSAAVPRWRNPLFLGGVAMGCIPLVAILVGGTKALFPPAPHQSAPVEAPLAQPIHAPEVADALLNLDEQRLRLYLRQGWNPNWHLDSESNAALHILPEACERNQGHDREALVRIAQMLVAAGEDYTAVNRWGDTPLSIARSERYCKPDHPVVAYLRGLATRAQSGAGSNNGQ